MKELCKNFKYNNITIVRVLCYEIRERNPDAVKFVVDQFTVNSLLFYLTIRKYDTMMYIFGHLFLMELMKMFEEEENFEECNEILKQIEKHNKNLNDNIPTRWK